MMDLGIPHKILVAILINGIMLCGMNRLTLTSIEIIALKQAHRACKDKRAADRIKAVYSLSINAPFKTNLFLC